MTKTGKNIKLRRQILNMSAEALAEKTGISPATIYRYENGSIDNMPITKLVPIAKALMITPAALIGMDDEELLRVPNHSTELLELFNSMNAEGQRALLAVARSFAENESYKKKDHAAG